MSRYPARCSVNPADSRRRAEGSACCQHFLDQTGPMLTPFYEARAWQIATQIIRRAPAKLTLLESEFMDGFYILHSIVPRHTAGPLGAYEHRVIDVNRHGTILGRADRPVPAALEQASRSRRCCLTGHETSTGSSPPNWGCRIPGRCRHPLPKRSRSGLYLPGYSSIRRSAAPTPARRASTPGSGSRPRTFRRLLPTLKSPPLRLSGAPIRNGGTPRTATSSSWT